MVLTILSALAFDDGLAYWLIKAKPKTAVAKVTDITVHSKHGTATIHYEFSGSRKGNLITGDFLRQFDQDNPGNRVGGSVPILYSGYLPQFHFIEYEFQIKNVAGNIVMYVSLLILLNVIFIIWNGTRYLKLKAEQHSI